MKRTGRNVGIAAAALALAVVGFALARDLSDGLVLRTTAEDGTRLPTRLWFVEEGGVLFVRGAPDSQWVARIRKNGEADVVRPGKREDVRAAIVSDRKLAARIGARFREKYGWLDRLERARTGDSFLIVRLSSPWPRRVGGDR
ncbi:MAG: DUF2255 family protein [Myxococcales bacterium]|nr:DUF2255 family protein [Myxococcales bacterium]